MNICGNGICVCDNYEYPETACADSKRDILGGLKNGLKNWNPRYYFDQTYGVVLSVQADEMVPGVEYYMDPDLRTRSTT